MFTKEKLARFLLALAVFAAADAWIFTTLRSSLRTNAARSRESALILLARSAPEDPSLREGWLASVSDSLPGGAAVYLVPSEADPNDYETYAADEAALELWRSLGSSPDAEKGLESAYYFEHYASPVGASLAGVPVRLFFAPVTDDAQSELLGIAVFMAPETADPGLERLLAVFAVGALVGFAALSGVSRFSRDPTVGYAVLALAGLAAGVGWWFAAGPGSTVTIADVRGETVEAARAILDEQGVLVADALGERYDLEIEPGRVVGTDPQAGETIDRETPVTIIVSLGPEPTTVPSVLGLAEADARAELVAAGFVIDESIRQFDGDVADGSVIALLDVDQIALEAGADSFKGTTVILVVSVGPVPEVRGLTVEAAQAALSARELTGIVGGTSEFDNDVALGDVLRVEPTAEGPIRPGATLTIIVSRGPDLVEVPNVVGRSINDAVAALEAAGFRVELDTNVPPGLRGSQLAPVQSTNPAGGERILRNARVTVVARY